MSFTRALGHGGVRHLLNAVQTIPMSLSLRENAVTSCRLFKRRALISGGLVLALSLFSGIAMMFWREYGGDLLRMPRRVVYDLTVQAILGPIYFGSVFLFPLSVLVAFITGILVYAGFKSKRLWILTLAFILLGMYWLWLVKLIADGAFD